MWKCPYCKNTITYLEYTADSEGYESGSASLSEEYQLINNRIYEYETEDQGTNETSNYEYACPECNHYIQISELIWKKKEEKKQETTEEPEETLHKIINPKKNIFSNKTPIDTTQIGIICKKCSYTFAFEEKTPWDLTKEEFFECPKCSTITSKEEYFNKINKT